MRKKILMSAMVNILFLILLLPSLAIASAPTEDQQVTQTIENFYKSLNTQDGDLYLTSIANSNLPSYQSIASNLEQTHIDYQIINIEKKSDYKYEVVISKIENGLDYPLIPYDLIKEDGKWKIDTSSIVIYSEKGTTGNSPELTRSVNSDYSKNENFIVEKSTANNDIQIPKSFKSNSTLGSLGALTYNFNQQTTNIYLSGSATAYFYPITFSSQGIYFEIIQVGSQGGFPAEARYVTTSFSTSESLNGYYGYYYFRATSTATGTYAIYY